MDKSGKKIRIAIFASGAGSNARVIISTLKEVEDAEVALVVCNKAGAGVINIARNENIEVLLIERERFFKGDGYIPFLKETKVDLIVLAGFLWKIPDQMIGAYRNRIINIHPALLPKFGGKGMYGQAVHEAVIQNKESESGITIHLVDEHYDHGDVIFQARCAVSPDDTAETLSKKVQHLEHRHYPEQILNLISEIKNRAT